MAKKQICCAACTYQKRRCSPECPLAPIFPPHRSEDFEAVVRVFSAHKFITLIKEAEPHQQVLAAESLINEAKARIADPVCGLTGTVYNLSSKLKDLCSELVLMKQQNEVHCKRNALHSNKVGSSSSALVAVPSLLLKQLDRLGTDPQLPVPSNKKSCGACRNKKKKCLAQCPFAPFFPLDKTADFENVAKVFGAANFLKLIMKSEDSLQHLAADSMIFEAKARISDPVHGLVGIVDNLSQQLDDLTSELSAVNQQNRFQVLRSIVVEHKSRKKGQNQSTSAKGASSPAPEVIPSPLLQDLNNSPSPLPFDTKNGGLSSSFPTVQVDVKPTVASLSVYTNQLRDMDSRVLVVNSNQCSSGAIFKCSKNARDLTKSSFQENKDINGKRSPRIKEEPKFI